MPANPKTLQATEEYRRRVIGARKVLQDRAEAIWPTIEELETSDWAERIATTVAQAQVQAVRITSAYLGAVLTLETGQRTKPPTIDSDRYANLSRDGRPLVESFRSALVGVKVKLSEGYDYLEALKIALSDAVRLVGVEYDHAHRQSMLDAIAEDNRFVGWSRAVAGTCGACAAAADGTISEELHFEVHPGCQCVTEPEVDRNAVRQQEVKQAQEQLDKTLGAGERPSVIYRELDDGTGGQMDPKTGKMSITTSETVPPQALVSIVHHEFGHFIDYKKLSGPVYFEASTARKALLKVIRRSNAVKDLREIAQGLSGGNKAYLKYLLSEDELIARAFQAYMAKKNPGSAKSAKFLWGLFPDTPTNKRIARAMGFSDDDLAEIESAVEAYVKAKGF